MNTIVKRTVWWFLFLAMIVLQGCSSRAWYEGLQGVRERECYELQGSQRDECLKNADTGYNQYKKERREVTKKEPR